MTIIEEIRHFVESECKKPSSHYGYEPFSFHFVPVVRYATQLTEILGGDKEVIILAAWLHDIGSIISGRKDHHITGSLIAEKKLQDLHYPQDKIDIIKECIYNHRGSQHHERKTIEEQIVADADTLSTFDNISGIFKAAFIYEKLDQRKAQISVRQKLQRKYDQLYFDHSKKLITPRYKAAMLLLQ